MTLLFTVFLVLHGLIHLLGVAKAFGLADLPQLTSSISPLSGALWLAAALLFVAAAAAIHVWPRGWWTIGAVAVVVSTAAIVPSWTDAKVGALANVVVLAGVVFGFLAWGPTSLRAAYEDHVAAIRVSDTTSTVTEADLARLPESVRRYLRVTGVVGQPRVRAFRVRMRGRIRSGPTARWMPLEAEQHNTIAPPSRLFYMTASMFLVPAQGYHRYIGPSAAMDVKVAGLVPVAHASGREMTQSETVTLFNDMCVMAPATLIDPAIHWEAVDGRTVRAAFTNAGYTIRAELRFGEGGELVDFVSEDRYQLLPDGTIRKVRWSTPLRDYRSFGSVRIASGGEGRWHEEGGEYAYIELAITDVTYNQAEVRRDP